MKSVPVSGDSSLLKSINKATLLKLIRRFAPLSRADLSKKTNLTRATVSALVEELIRGHLVVESGTGSSSGGRKPTMLEINRSGGFVIGADLRATDIFMIVTNLNGEKITASHIKYKQSGNPEAVVEQLIQAAARLRATLPESPLGLIGLGIGIHGFVQHPSGRILFVPHFGWHELDWKDRLEAALGVPVCMDNEANLAALGELEHGAAAECSNVIYVSVGSGIGAGIIFEGELFKGNYGYAGEVGHTTIEREGRLCTCGNRGCWEMYASEKAFASLLGLPYTPEVQREIRQRLEAGDPAALAAVQKIGGALGVGLVNLMHTLNPQMIIIGNAMAQYAHWIEAEVVEALNSRIPFPHMREISVKYSRLGAEACPIGAAALVIRNFMNMEEVRV